MKTFKKFTMTTFALTGFAILASGGYNTMLMQDDSFMNAASEITFAKRLDELNGEVVVGRMAASTTWKEIELQSAKEHKPERVQVQVAQKQEAVEESVERLEIAEPAIKDDLDLSLSNVFYKKPFKQGEFSGSATTVDGIVEEVSIELPDNQKITINTRERMQGNVFQYEDAKTRKMVSAMIYEVRAGTYMITLPEDSRYPQMRMEFTTGEGSEVAFGEDHYDNTQEWGMDRQNHSGEVAEEVEYKANNDQQEYYQDEPYAESHGFNFQG